MDQAIASEALRRFDNCIKTAARNVAETFPSVTTAEDAAQEASILVLSYAGLVPGGRHAGMLAGWERITGGAEDQVKRLVANELRLDLSEMYGREYSKQEPSVPLDSLPDSRHPSVTFEDRALNRVDTEQLRLDFPYLTARYLNGLTESEIAEAEGVSRSTVTRRVAKERDVFLVNFLTSRGLVVEGDESAEELLEAYGHLKAAGR